MRSTGKNNFEMVREASGLKEYGYNEIKSHYLYVSFQRPPSQLYLQNTETVDIENYGYVGTNEPYNIENLRRYNLAPIGKAFDKAFLDNIFIGLEIEKTNNGKPRNLLFTKSPTTKSIRVTLIDENGPYGHYDDLQEAIKSWANPIYWIDATFFDFKTQ